MPPPASASTSAHSSRPSRESLAADDCECIAWAILPGVFAPCNGEFGIEAHDDCREYAGDIEAAEALAAHLASITGRTYEIWYEETRP
jgi:hypothetical protein